MKKTILILAIALGAFACTKPEEVKPTSTVQQTECQKNLYYGLPALKITRVIVDTSRYDPIGGLRYTVEVLEVHGETQLHHYAIGDVQTPMSDSLHYDSIFFSYIGKDICQITEGLQAEPTVKIER